MKSFISLFIKALPFTAGIILILTSLAFLTEVTELDDEEYLMFIFFSVIGIPLLLFGIKALQMETSNN